MGGENGIIFKPDNGSEVVSMRVLVVEDDKKIASFVVKGLKEAGYAADHVPSGEEALALVETYPFDAAIVDIMLPGMDGLVLIEKMRQKKINTPVIILSAKRSVDDRIRGLKAGGDDYLTKPFSFSELLMRVRALLRRSSMAQSPVKLQAGDLEMDLLRREVTRDGKRIELQPREFALLEYMMRNEGIVLSKTVIMEHVWGYHFDPQTNVVDVLVSRLRNKIDRDFPSRLIDTIRGVGYVLRVSKKHRQED
jgi:DNA-binding response OmpR family regulator